MAIAVNTIALGELGRTTFASHATCKLISFWLRVLKHSEDRYTKRCYNDQVILAERGHASWGLDVKNILFRVGFGDVWLNQGVGDEDLFVSIFKQRVIDINMQDWKSNLISLDSLRTYNVIKNDYFVEYYTLFLNQFHLRKLIAKLRCGVLDIEVNRGRRNNIPYIQRKCSFCYLNLIGDEFHFMLVCPFLTDLLIPRHYYFNPGMERFTSLVNTDSKQLLYCIALFKYHSLQSREKSN